MKAGATGKESSWLVDSVGVQVHSLAFFETYNDG